MRLYRPVKYNSTSVNAAGGSNGVVTPGVGVAGVRLFATTDCWVRIGTSQILAGATDSFLLPAGRVEMWAVQPGDVIRFISTNEASGTLLITELGL